MSLSDTIGALVKSAKELRSIAESLNNVELKARIVDELLRLHELREQLSQQDTAVAGADQTTEVSIPVVEDPVPETSFVDEDRAIRLEPSPDGETYQLHADEPEPQQPAAAAVEADVPDAQQVGNRKNAAEAADSEPPQPPKAASDSRVDYSGLTEKERFSLAEENLRELEPLHQAALKKMNAILTAEQRKKKAAATKAGLQAGKKGADLQQQVMAVLELSEEQQRQMAAARKELQRVRTAMAKHVEGMLTSNQLDRVLKEMARKQKKKP